MPLMSSVEASPSKPPDAVWKLDFGARPLPQGGVSFRVWAPHASRLSVQLIAETTSIFPMRRGSDDIFECVVPQATEGTDYFYVIDDVRPRPDPVSRCQPHGVHGPSRVVNPDSFPWTDQNWTGIPLREFIFYELHVGAFTADGTFEGIIPKLPHLRDLGITAIELMPVASFPGSRNWGYDGVHLYAPQSTYGGPAGLKKLVDTCHQQGLAVVLDVVYNHLGPEGNYLPEYGPYLTRKYHTPWGDAINYDEPESDGVRRHMVNNVLYWLTEYHVDALRLDAIHGVFDFSASHILREMRDAFRKQVRCFGRQAWLIAESDLNDVRVINATEQGGYGIDAQWSDDFHHALLSYVLKSSRGYFADFGRLEHLRKAIVEGFVYDGIRSAYRRRRHGSSSKTVPGSKLIVCIQNHDQIANGSHGERIANLVSVEQHKLAATILMLAPNLPLLFMGQEFGEVSRFFYFTSHADPTLGDAVREGRRSEYAAFCGDRDFPDPQDPHTFEQSKILWSRTAQPFHRDLLRFYRDVVTLRKLNPCLSNCRKDLSSVTVDETAGWMIVRRTDPCGSAALLICNLSTTEQAIPVDTGGQTWRLALWTGSPAYVGPANGPTPPAVLPEEPSALQLRPWTAAVYLQDQPAR